MNICRHGGLPYFLNGSQSEYRPPPPPPPQLEAALKAENFILKAIAYHMSSNISREVTTEKTYEPRPVFDEIR